ncbi:hypothetical protein VCSRO56_3250 [Vibrio cholerae]|nr:hypothetical protein VCSRO56_3250 [Vibrio cholerae]
MKNEIPHWFIHRDKKQRCGAAFFISTFCPFPLLDDGSLKQ